MKNFIKIIAMLIVLSMLVATFAACGGKEEETEAVTESETVADETPEEAEGEVIKIINKAGFLALVEGLNANPEQSKGKTYKLMADIDLFAGWSSSPTEKLGQFTAPGAITAFAGINEFYGVFDGNGKTISAVYMSKAGEATDAIAFIGKLNGGTVKDLVVNNSFVMDNGGKGAIVSGLVGEVNGADSVIENVTVNTNVYSASDSAATVAGVVGKVSADGLKMTGVTYGGKVGNISSTLNVKSPSTVAVLGQMIADGGDKTITMSGCKANGAIIANDGATADAFCAKGASKLTKTDCTVTAPSDSGTVENQTIEVYTVEEFKSLATLGSNFSGATVKLMRDIDLNPDWTASTTAPTNVWAGIAEFAGVLDGNGKMVSGLYGESFIASLNGGTVKNLLVLNSAFVSADDASVGFIGTVNGGTVVDVYSEASVTFTGSSAANVGGIAGKTEGASTFENVVFAGVISANGKTADLIANGTATYKNVLAIGTGATTAATGTCVLAEKKDASFLTGNAAYADWKYSAYLESVAPKTIAELLRFLALEADTSWYNASANTFEISTPEQLLGLSVLGQTETFEGKTIKLTADIDLNPNWDATTIVDSAANVTLADPANNKWTAIPMFKGTIDGQGHSISGIYSEPVFQGKPSSGLRYVGGVIDELVNGTIKNLIIDNSLTVFTPAEEVTSGSSSICLGGMISRVVDSTLETLYVDLDTWVKFDLHYTMGGMICEMETANTATRTYSGVVKDIVYAGTTGRVVSDGKWNTPSGSSKIYCAGMIAQSHLSKVNADVSDYNYMTAQNLAFIGVCYRPVLASNSVTGDALMAYTGGGHYNAGMAVNNSVIYTNEAAFDKDPGEINTAADAQLTDVAKDYTNKNGVVTENDTYADTGWKTMVIANGAGIETAILIPGTVVDMLTAYNA